MLDLTIGVPLRAATPSQLARRLRLAALLNPAQIIVSINDPACQINLALAVEAEPSIAELLDRIDVRVAVQSKNLGLYGNFRWLLSEARCTYFLWYCDDDQASLDQSRLIKTLDREADLALAVPPQELWRWSRDEGFVSRLGTLTRPVRRMPTTASPTPPSARNSAIVWPDPSWIFGTWRTSALKAAFPTTDFDWLDFQMLILLSLEGRIEWVECEAARIGAQPDRIPASVGRWFNPAPFCARAISELFYTRQLREHGRIAVASAIGVIRASASLNWRRFTYRSR